MKAERFLDVTMDLGEGPVWDERTGRLHWVDIARGQLWTHDTGTGETGQVKLGDSLGMAVPAAGGGMVAALAHEIVLYREGQTTVLAGQVEAGLPDNRFNDGKCDARGRLLAGTMDTGGRKGRGKLYMLEEGRPLRVLLEEVTISNGLGFSPDKRFMYYVDTPTGYLWRFDYDLDSGALSGRTALIDYSGEAGNFDGLCVDDEGMLWVAHWGGHQVSRWDPATGRKIGRVEVPAPLVTSCCFGGTGMDTLFITTARGWDEQQIAEYPLSGALFAVRPGVTGPVAERFGSGL
jgi:sugar lactone lactonase YvrE